MLGNGTAVYGATVVVGASADLPLAVPPDDVLARPRESRGTTDANGYFDVLSDLPAAGRPGVVAGAIDVSVRPLDGTHLPWVVLTNVQSAVDDGGAPRDINLPVITLPLPTPYPPSGSPSVPGELTDSSGNALPGALVRAYAFPAMPPTADGGTPRPRGARLIGMTQTDDHGSFQLFVVPPDP